MEKRLSQDYEKDIYEEGIEENLFDANTIIDEGFFLEVYINPDGKDSDISEGTSYFVYIDRDTTYNEFIKKFSEAGGSIKEDTMKINIIPVDDVSYRVERNEASNFSSIEV